MRLTIIFNLILLIGLLFNNCSSKSQKKITKLFQSDSAYCIRDDYSKIIKIVIQLKQEIDKRNPHSFNKSISHLIIDDIKNSTNRVSLQYNNKNLSTYKEYLHVAFSKENIQNRNDYLILGLHKLIYEAYEVNKGFRITALTYSQEKMQKMYKNLQIIGVKMRLKKGNNKNYLFLTWQNNQQVELEKRILKGDSFCWNKTQDQEEINSRRNVLLSSPNFSFEILIHSLQERVKNSMSKLGFEAEDLGIQAIKAFVMFL